MTGSPRPYFIATAEEFQGCQRCWSHTIYCSKVIQRAKLGFGGLNVETEAYANFR